MKNKKKFYLVVSILIFTTLSGFRGCNQQQTIDFFGYLSYMFSAAHFVVREFGPVGSYSIAVGESGKIYTSDGRPPAQWVLRPSGTTQNLKNVKIGSPPAADFQSGNDSDIAYAIGNNATVLRSNDYGNTWVNRSIPGEYSNLYGLDVFSYSTTSGVHAVVCGDSGNVWKSTNTGGNWQWYWYYVGALRKLNSIAAAASFVWAAVGDNGAIFRTINGGETWDNRSISSSISLYKVVAPRYDRYCAVGTGGAIYTSTDYGYSWIPRSSGTTQTFRDVIFSSPDSGIAVGDNGTARLTTNGGVTWYSDSYVSGLTTRDIICITQVDENTVNTICRNPGSYNYSGADTTFFLAVSSEPFLGIEPISNFIADIFSLKQNYPNPFNPVTNIEISVPHSSMVKLIIYDIQGKIMETLVDKELRAGGYKIDWNASSYPSGVYFCSVTAGDFRETRKMVLVK
jgi:photosystem II stability/assembly factor-like uncharacterized protein